MTHLVLRLTINSTEQVNNSCIDDLYQLTTASALDNTSVLEGRLNTDISSESKILILHTLDDSTPPQPVTSGNLTRWDGLFVTATAYSLSFEDPVWALICANRWGDGSFVTRQLMAAVGYLPDGLAVDNPDLQVIDLGCCIMKQNDWARNTVFSNCPNVTKIIIGGEASSGINRHPAFKNIMKWLGVTHLTKFVLGDNIGATGGDIGRGQIDIVGMKNPTSFGNYWTRGNFSIGKIYLWTTTPPLYSGAYGDEISRIGEIYVPVGYKQTYIDDTNFNSNSRFTSKLYEYDFDADPDGIFTELIV